MAIDQTLAQSGSSDARDMAELLREHWQCGKRPDIHAFLAAQPPLNLEKLAALLCIDQRERWKSGERVLTETYLEKHPGIRNHREHALDLIFNEFLLRESLGETPRTEEYARRFPEFAEVLDEQIELHEALAGGSSDKGMVTELASAGAYRKQSAPSHVPDEIGNYSVLKVIGRGGMGVVYQAWDRGLNRVAAIKMVLGGAHAGPQDVARFRNEAEAVARLQHPNIVQVHEVGQERGHWFLALEFVDGGSLNQHLAGTPLPARRAAELTETLARAMQYAHERGIVHRDLTPANVLLTREGVPKITDFGLAKILVGGEAGQTQTGAILGTPSYMSPEQASGRAKYVSPAADVYSLGAILYDMLTGRPPFKAETPLETVLQVANQEPVAPTALQPKLPRDLETICLRCLQKEPGKRYATAADLAMDLRHFQEGEPIRARPVGSLERGWRWYRRNRLAASLCVAVAVALVAVSVVSVLFALHSERARSDIAHEQAETARERDEKARALVAETNARTAEKQARDKAMAALRALTGEIVQDQMARGTQLTEENKEFLRQIIKHFEAFAGITADDVESRAIRAEGYFRVGLMRSRLGEFTDAESAYSAALALRKQLVADAPARPKFRQQLAESHNNLGLLLHGMGRLKEAELAQSNALTLRRQLADEFPNRSEFRQELSWSFNNLSTLYEAMGRSNEAETGYLAAIALQQQLREEFPARSEIRHDLARHKYNLGNLLRDAGRLKEAEIAFGEALVLRKQLVNDFPRRPEFRYVLARTQVNLGNVLGATGRLKEADSVHAEALALLKQLAAEFPMRPEFRHDLAISQGNLGHRLRDSGRLEEAETAYAATVALANRLVDDFPTQPEFRQELAKGHNSLGTLLATMGRLKEAEEAYNAALALRKQLDTDFPALPGLRQELAGNHNNLAILFGDTERLKEAEAAFGNALALQRQLLADFPTPKLRQELGGSLNGLGALLQTTDRLKEAETVLAEALAIRKQLATESPNQPDFQNELAGTYVNVAVLCRERRDFRQAKAYLEEAAPHHESALKANPQNPTYREFYQNNLGNVIQTNADLGDQAGAKQAAERLRDLDWDPPGDAYDAACYLSRCISCFRKLEDATTEERDKQMRFYGDEAMKMLRHAVARGWKDSAHMKNDSDLDPLREREDFKKLLAELEAGKSHS